jgi:nitrogen fixation protein NifB
MPAETSSWLTSLQAGGKKITGIELGGPGDVLASWPATQACLQVLHQEVPQTPLSLTCLGLGGAEIYPDLLRFGVSKVTMLVDTVSPETAMKLYAWIRPGKKTIPLAQSAHLLIKEQDETIKSLVHAGIKVVVRTRIQEGVNDLEVALIAKQMAESGVSTMEIDCAEDESKRLVAQASAFLEATVVPLEPELSPPGTPQPCTGLELPAPSTERPNVAVASGGGMEVDLHLGQAGQLLIYGPREDGLACLLETRSTPDSGSPDRWQSLADSLSDCFVLLASHAGEEPRRQMAENGIRVILTDDQVEGLVDTLYGGGQKRKCKNSGK